MIWPTDERDRLEWLAECEEANYWYDVDAEAAAAVEAETQRVDFSWERE